MRLASYWFMVTPRTLAGGTILAHHCIINSMSPRLTCLALAIARTEQPTHLGYLPKK
jgi:hypothetical protein